jgi:hypothetical protein
MLSASLLSTVHALLLQRPGGVRRVANFVKGESIVDNDPNGKSIPGN